MPREYNPETMPKIGDKIKVADARTMSQAPATVLAVLGAMLKVKLNDGRVGYAHRGSGDRNWVLMKNEERTPVSHNRLVEQVCSGKSAQHIIDALVEELPPLPMLYQIVRKEMPRGTGVRIEETVVFVKPQSKTDKPRVTERSDYLALMFPELEFVIEKFEEKA